MKYEQFALTEEQLDEVAMSPSALDKFVNSDEAAGIKAGFEAELCFPGKSGGGEPDYDNPEMDESEDRRARNIEDVCDFFHDGDYNGRREIERMRDRMTDEYNEWFYEKTEEGWSSEREDLIRREAKYRTSRSEWIENYLRDELELDDEQIEKTMDKSQDDFPNANYMEALDAYTEAIDEMVEEAIEEENELYNDVYEEYRDDFSDQYDEEEWLNDGGIRYMSDVPGNYDVSWPYWTYPEGNSGGWNDDGARDVASDLRANLGVEVKVGGGYHTTTRRPGLWIIEPDGSLDADDIEDLPAEIVSPPYPLGECLDKMRQFFEWAGGEMGAYSNKSTGLHVGVSLPFVDGRVDLVKLALFLGDRYVLDQFQRASNTYAESALGKIEKTIGHMPVERVEGVLDLMRSGIIELAGTAIKRGGYGKYTSINLKDDYIEFRSMGNNYMDHVDEVINNVKRYAYAMYIASRPDLYRDEYARKLYALLKDAAKSGGEDVVKIFARYTSKHLSKEELKDLLRQRKAQRSYRKDGSGKWRWKIYKNGKGSPNGATMEVVAGSKEEALEIAAHSWRYPDVSYLSDADVEVIAPFTGDMSTYKQSEPTSGLWPFPR